MSAAVAPVSGAPGRPVAPADRALLYAILATGIGAGLASSPILLGTTIVMAAIVIRQARRRTSGAAASLEAPELPRRTRRVIDETADAISPGPSRELLASVVAQARQLYQAYGEGVDLRRDDRDMLADVAELVEAACTSALELWRLDAAGTGATGSASHAESLARSRARFVEPLVAATGVIRELHVAAAAGGSTATERVAELTSELRDDARVCTLAMLEIESLLHGRAESLRTSA